MLGVAGRSGVIALTTWLLLQPPADGGVAMTGAPLGSWLVIGRYPTKEACEQARSTNLAVLAYGEATSGTSVQGRAARGVITAAFCTSEEALRAKLAPPTPSPGE